MTITQQVRLRCIFWCQPGADISKVACYINQHNRFIDRFISRTDNRCHVSRDRDEAIVSSECADVMMQQVIEGKLNFSLDKPSLPVGYKRIMGNRVLCLRL